LNAVIFDFNRARVIDEFCVGRLSTRLGVPDFAADRSALLLFDCLAKGYAVKVSATFDTVPFNDRLAIIVPGQAKTEKLRGAVLAGQEFVFGALLLRQW
jgi:hypothetical protein